jgi:signal transduction histidine kinase/CheY-like chemotaxis protein
LSWYWESHARTQAALAEAQDQRLELQQALADLSHASRQLALANERLAAMHEVAEDAQRTKSAFVAKVSHEFRTPLNIIIGLTGLLVESAEVDGQPLPPTLVQDLTTIWRNCTHLSALVNDVLDLSQAEAERLTLQREWVNLADIVDSAVAVVKPLVTKKRLRLQLELPVDLPRVYCDRNRIRQVILNLVSNAARFTDAGGIVIALAQRGDTMRVSVADTGPGIAPEDQERVFEPFCQGSDQLWRDRGGSGLGLTISRQFVEMHQGRIWLESEPGKGTTFTFEIPIDPPAGPANTSGRWIVEDWLWHERTEGWNLPDLSTGPRVVVYDEVGGLCSTLAREAPEGVEVVDGRTPGFLSDDAHPFPGHVLLLNVADPARLWAGVEAARALAPDTPVVGCCVPAQRHALAESGVVDYLIKPILRETLLAAIARLGGEIRCILIVDDDPDMRDILSRMLGADGRWETATAASGAEALAALAEEAPDLVLLDLMMPDMDGSEVLRRKAQDPATRDIPVIVISAQDPFEGASVSRGALVTAGEGLSLGVLLRLSLAASRLLLAPGR